jgi:hypothetical protein
LGDEGLLLKRIGTARAGDQMRSILLLLGFLLIAPTSGIGQTAPESNALPLADLIREVKVALLQVADATDAQSLPKLDSAVLQVNATLKKGADGKMSLWVVELGGGQSGEYASSVTLTLKPPKAGSPSDIAAVRLADALRDAILTGARAIRAAEQGNPPLIADKLEASVRFAIQQDASGKLAVKFPPFEVSGGGSFSSTAVQTITVTYKN